ncbi:MAG: hypothetical protein HRU15_13155, partial [Planctomycetes bacterium]|nr:hypothetical protein [Planctomycetota bacterium]
GEWDAHNHLQTIPSSSKHGVSWDNSACIGPWQEETAEIIRRNHDYFELCLHGVGHEFWQDGTFTRGEWYNPEGVLRSHDDVEKRLDFFHSILDEYNLGGFPQSHVPPSFTHIYDPAGESFMPYLKKRGVRSMSTPFACMLNNQDILGQQYVMDNGILCIDRGAEDVLEWDAHSMAPSTAPSTVPSNELNNKISAPIIGMHWSNMLHADASRNTEIVDHWVEFLRPLTHSMENMLARNTNELISQLLHHCHTEIQCTETGMQCQFNIPAEVSQQYECGECVLHVQADSRIQFSSDDFTIADQQWNELGGFHILRILRHKDHGLISYA